jgi:hypothetical protein
MKVSDVIRINDREIQHISLYRYMPAAAIRFGNTHVKCYRLAKTVRGYKYILNDH